MNKEKYKKMVEKASPNSKIFSNCFKAFIIGGLICTFGQLLINIFSNMGLSYDNSSSFTTVLLIFIGAIATGFGWYSKLGKFAGAGSIVPVTGFSNSVASSALEYKKEGYILGVGAKIFTVAGPVILYGIITSIIVGLIYYFIK